MPADLNDKQEAFCQEYLKDLNATQAAIRAGYSEDTARSQGQRLLTHVDVAKRISNLKAERSERTQIDADWVLRRLADEVDADLADLMDETTGALRRVHDWPEIWRKGLVAGLEVSEITGDKDVKIGDLTKIKLSDRVKRLELIGKHVGVGAFSDRLEVTGKTLIIKDLSGAD